MVAQPITIANLIQGVSQQAPVTRRPTQCQAQENCVNSPADGADARPSLEVIRMISEESGDIDDPQPVSLNLAKSYCYPIQRGDESYLVVVKEGVLRVYDLTDGTACTVDLPIDAGIRTAIAGYLTVGSGVNHQDKFAAITVDDFTFIANKTVPVQMDTDVLSPTRPYEGIFHFKAGGYLTTYSVSIKVGDTVYHYTYKTPDNSVAGNAAYITTNHLAATFFRAMTGGATGAQKADPTVDYTEEDGLIGQIHAGTAGTAGTETQDLTTIGFSLHVNGPSVHIWSDAPFTLDVDDGLGNAQLIGFTDSVAAFSKLPATGFQGYVVKVKGDDRQEEDDYYVEYSATGTTGQWDETIKGGIAYRLRASVMPVKLVNTGFRTFTLDQVEWGERVSGDEDSDPDPNFVGKTIRDFLYNDQRMGILTEATVMWSLVDDATTFFRSTVQTTKDDDPIGFNIASREIAIIERGVNANEHTGIWARRQQFAVRTDGQPFTAENVSIKQSTSYDFNFNCAPVSVGTSLYFVTQEEAENDVRGWSTVRDVLYVDGKARGDTEVTSHVPKYVPAEIERIAACDTRNTLLLCGKRVALESLGEEGGTIEVHQESLLFCYNYFIQNQERIQSAWNTWRFPPGVGEIIWHGFVRSKLYVLVQDGVPPPTPDDTGTYDRCVLLKLVLNQRNVDPVGGDYHTRLDWRVTQDQCTVTYDAVNDRSEIKLPYLPAQNDDTNYPVTVALQREMRQAEDFAVVHPRGARWLAPIKVGTQDTVLVEGVDLTTGDLGDPAQFVAGYPIRSFMEFSEPYLRDPDSETAIILDRLQVENLSVVYANSGYSRIEVTYEDGHTDTYTAEGEGGNPKLLIDAAAISLTDGVLNATVNSATGNRFTVKLLNDSVFPSRWQAAEWGVKATSRRARPGISGA